jgi:hypothetical protein
MRDGCLRQLMPDHKGHEVRPHKGHKEKARVCGSLLVNNTNKGQNQNKGYGENRNIAHDFSLGINVGIV